MKSLDESIAEIGGLICDRTRASMLISLMEGRALTAGELALRSNISPQTASNHLSKLMKANLLICESSGRHRYYKIASSDVASALEAISILAGSPKRTAPQHNKLENDICFARTCYDHLAGELGVKLTTGLLRKKIILYKDNNFSVTKQDEHFFNQLGIPIETLIKKRRQFAKPCLDWTERKYHLAGSLGAALLENLINDRLIIRSKRKTRVVVLTTKGEFWFRDKLGINLTQGND